MQEHPVPQNITAYEFHLIGSMTIKQFLILLAGGAVGLFFYSTNLPGILKWPLATVGVLSGIAMAFVPYEERTLDQWFVNFVKAIYRPTKFYWRRTSHVPSFFTHVANVNTTMLYQPDTSPMRQKQVSQYLSSLNTPTQTAPADQLDLFQDPTNVLALFGQVEAAANVAPSQNVVSRPNLMPRARALGRNQQVVYSSPSQETTVDLTPNPLSTSTGQILSEDHEETRVEAAASEAHEEARLAAVPLVTVEPTVVVEETPPPAPVVATPTAEGHYLPAQNTGRVTQGIQPAIFNRSLPFPSIPTTPNLLVGMVHDTAHNIIPNAIVEILDGEGNTVRAMKTNTLGQFYISSPLKAGTYTIETEHEGFTFPIFGFEANDTVLDPIDIQATG